MLCVDVGHFKIEIKYILIKLLSFKECFCWIILSHCDEIYSCYLWLSFIGHIVIWGKRRERLPVSHRFEQSEIIVIFSFLKGLSSHVSAEPSSLFTSQKLFKQFKWRQCFFHSFQLLQDIIRTDNGPVPRCRNCSDGLRDLDS